MGKGRVAMAKVLLGTSAGNGNGALRDWRGLLSLRLTVGPAAYIVLTVMVLQHPVLSNHAIVLTGDVFLGLSVAGLANALAFLGLALLYAWRRIVFHGLRYQAIVVVLLVTGIIGEFALSGAGEGMIVPMVAANVLSGVGLACLAVGQVRLFAGAPSRQAAANLLVGMFGAALAIALAAMLDPLLSLFACLLLVDVSFAALRVEGGRGAAARYGEKTPLAIPWKLVATLAVQGLSTGFVQKSVVLASQEGFFLAEGIAFVLAGLLALVFLWRLNRDFNHLLYVIAFPLLALGHLAMALVGETLGAVIVHEVGYRFIMFLSWMLAVWVIKHKDLSANWVWPCIMCAFVGALIGFLWYNAYPAQIFMGDTGSLTIGGIIAVGAIIIHKELMLPILCGIFFVESLSVMMQVWYYKMGKRRGVKQRIFKRAPIHDTFRTEDRQLDADCRYLWRGPKSVVHESKITIRFWIVTIILAALTIITLKVR